jgi:hypothetical protein
MPALETLFAPASSRIRRLALIVLRCQLTFAAVLLIAKVVQLGVSG